MKNQKDQLNILLDSWFIEVKHAPDSLLFTCVSLDRTIFEKFCYTLTLESDPQLCSLSSLQDVYNLMMHPQNYNFLPQEKLLVLKWQMVGMGMKFFKDFRLQMKMKKQETTQNEQLQFEIKILRNKLSEIEKNSKIKQQEQKKRKINKNLIIIQDQSPMKRNQNESAFKLFQKKENGQIGKQNSEVFNLTTNIKRNKIFNQSNFENQQIIHTKQKQQQSRFPHNRNIKRKNKKKNKKMKKEKSESESESESDEHKQIQIKRNHSQIIKKEKKIKKTKKIKKINENFFKVGKLLPNQSLQQPEYNKTIISDDKVRIDFRNGDFFYGQVLNNQYHGWGFCSSKKFGTYDGYWKFGKRNGFGKYEDPDHIKYEGQFKEDMKEGKGTEIFTNGEKYIGQYKNDCKQGFGTYYFSNGDRYEGYWKNDLSHGKGKEFFADGSFFQGHWTLDQKHGQGVFYNQNGAFKQFWQNGILQRQQRLRK